MNTYWLTHSEKITQSLIEHMTLVLSAISISLMLSLILIGCCIHHDLTMNRLIYFFSTIYAIPSYAFFAILIPLTGLGKMTAIIVMALYCHYILLRTFVTGIRQVDPLIIESARGMGFTNQQLLLKIQLPLSIRSFFAGIRLALISTIGIATIAATINAGGLGVLLFEGLRTQNTSIILLGTLLTMLLCMVFSGLLYFIEKKIIHLLKLEG